MIPAFEAIEGGRSGTIQQLSGRRLSLNKRGQIRGRSPCPILLSCIHFNMGKVNKGGEGEDLPIRDFSSKEKEIVLGLDGLQDVVSWIMGLDDDAAGRSLASPVSHHFHHKIEEPLTCPKIWQTEQVIGEQDANEGSSAKMQGFDDHLGSD